MKLNEKILNKCNEDVLAEVFLLTALRDHINEVRSWPYSSLDYVPIISVERWKELAEEFDELLGDEQ